VQSKRPVIRFVVVPEETADDVQPFGACFVDGIPHDIPRVRLKILKAICPPLPRILGQPQTKIVPGEIHCVENRHRQKNRGPHPTHNALPFLRADAVTRATGRKLAEFHVLWEQNHSAAKPPHRAVAAEQKDIPMENIVVVVIVALAGVWAAAALYRAWRPRKPPAPCAGCAAAKNCAGRR